MNGKGWSYMEVQFAEKDLNVIISKLKEVMGDRELSKMVNFDKQGDGLLVTISKLGTSTLQFDCKQTPQGCHLTLSKEKIALAHRPLKGDVTSKIIKVIEKAGGKVS